LIEFEETKTGSQLVKKGVHVDSTNAEILLRELDSAAMTNGYSWSWGRVPIYTGLAVPEVEEGLKYEEKTVENARRKASGDELDTKPKKKAKTPKNIFMSMCSQC